MATGTISYASQITGLQPLRLEQTEVASSHPAIDRIVIETQGDKQLTIVFHLVDVFSKADADALTKDIADDIVNRLAFEVVLSIDQPHRTGLTLPKDTSGSRSTLTVSNNLRWNVEAPPIEPGPTERQELTKLLEQPGHNLYSAYRFALNQSDAVARFMWLYNILLQLEGGSRQWQKQKQKPVDNFIRSVEPDVKQSQRPGEQYEETIYSRLRNEVGHKRPDATPQKTRDEIKENVSGLQELVKEAISRHV